MIETGNGLKIRHGAHKITTKRRENIAMKAIDKKT